MRNIKRAAWATCFLANLILCGCARNRVAAPANDGGTMSDFVFQRLGKVVPGKQSAGDNSEDRIDGRPIVLWRGSTPVAVLYTRLRSHAIGLSGEQRIERFDEQPGESASGRKRGPFPLVFGSPWSLEGKLLDDSDSFDTFNIVTADVNGDGVDELILPRVNGAIGVYSVEKELFHHSAPHTPRGTRFEVAKTYTAKLKGRDVVFFLLSVHEKKGHNVSEETLAKADQYAILRVDQRGISRVPLPQTDEGIAEIEAIGALNRPGSTDLDEILVLFDAPGRGERTYLSRQRADGGMIAPPKEVYVPIRSSNLRFLFLAETPQAVLADGSNAHLYFMRTDKPANWISNIDLKLLGASSDRIRILEPMEPGADPKVMVAVENWRPNDELDNEALYAVNAGGKCFQPDPAKNIWQPTAKHEPFLRLTPPTPDHRFAGVLPQPGTDVVLAVFSREAKMKNLTEEETMEAAERFLQPTHVAERRKYFEISMRDYKSFPTVVGSERNLKGVTTEVSTVEQWKELLPDSYQAVIADRKASLKIDFEVDLQSGISFSFSPSMYRDIEEYKVWLNALKLGPETVFETVRHGAVAAISKVGGYLPDTIDGFAGTWPLAFRADTARTSVILPLDITALPALTKQPLGFHLVQFSAKTF
jgi:hypothetical protein